MQRKKTQKTGRARNSKPKAELIEITCPECGATFSWDVPQEESDALIEVTCPECGATFEWDTVQEEADPEARNPANELLDITCPECGATFEWEVSQGEPDTGADNRKRAARKGTAAVNELFTVTCPECGATFEWEVYQGEPDGGTDNRRVDKYAAGIAAERNRLLALDSILAAYPEASGLVARAKREGWSFAKASRQVFGMVAKKKGTATAQDSAAGSAFLSGFAKDTTAGGGKVGAAPNGGHGNKSSGDDAQEIANIVDIVANMKGVRTGREGGRKA